MNTFSSAEIHYRNLFENARDGILILASPSGMIEDANPQILNMLGCSPEDLLGLKLWEAEPMLSAHLDPTVLASLDEGQTLELEDQPLTGRHHHILWADLSFTTYLADRERFILCQVRDVTGTKEAEESLRLQSAALNAAASPILITNRDGVIEWINPAFTNLTGYTGEEAVGRRPGDLLRSGKQDKAFYKELWETVLAGHVWHHELVNRRKDGSFYTEEETITPLRDASGEVSHFIAIKLDITDRKKSEALIQRQLEHLTALSSIDRIIAANFDLKLSLSEILEHVTNELRVDAADILVLNSYSQVLEYGADRGFRTETVKDAHIRLGDGYAGQAAFERRMVEINLLQSQPAALARMPHLAGEDFACYYAEPLIAKGQVKGVLEVHTRKPFDPEPEWCDFFRALAGQTAIAIDNANLFESLNRSNSELATAYDATIEGWSCALDLRDRETEGHTQRVTEMTVKLARFMGLSEADLVQVRWGSLLHDIGKMGIPDEILRKTGPLTPEETEEMKKHPVYAFDMLSPIRYLHLALDIPYCHHEKWDGSGYPRGLKGTQIPLVARIFSVVDVWDALHSDRPYRNAWDEDEVLQHIKSLSGSHFDPQVVDAFLHLPDWQKKR